MIFSATGKIKQDLRGPINPVPLTLKEHKMSALTNYTEETLDLSFDCVLPSAIFFNENLEPACIKAYAIIRNLTRMHGYCFATNEYLAKLLKAGESSVRRWLSSLENEGFLHIETEQNGIQWQRRIYLADEFKKVLRTLKNEHPPAQFRAPPCSKMSTIKEEKKKERKEESKEGPTSSPPSADADLLTVFFFNKIKERNPEFRKPNLQKWAEHMDRMLKIDKRDPEKVMKLIAWAAEHKWWKSACLSTEKLRKSYDQMVMQMAADEEKDLVRINRQYVLDLKEQYPEQLKRLSFDDKYVMNHSEGKEIRLNMPHEEFKDAVVSLFGGVRG